MTFKPVVFPLFAILPSGTCACGNAACGRVGKHPAIEWGDLSFGDPVPRPEEGAGIGIRTGAPPKGSGVFVVDLDGTAAQAAWDALGGFAGVTRTVQTGRAGGLQIYFAHPDFPVRNSAGDLAPGVDIRGDGGYVVAEGSPHKSGRTYTLVVDAPPAEAPTWLLEWLKARAAPAVPMASYPGDITDPDERAHRRDLYRAFLETTLKVRSQANRGHGDVMLYEVVQYGAYDLALPTEDVLDLVREHYDPRNDRPWGDELPERVAHKSHTAKTASTRPRMEPPPRSLASLFTLEPPPRPDPADTPRAAGPIRWGAWDEHVEPPQYLVQGLIPIETVGMFVAMGSSLKTWTALDIGRAIAMGVPWLGRFPVRPGRVVVVDYESGDYELRRRVRLLTKGEPLEKLGAWVYPTERMDDEGLWRALASVAAAPGGLALVILDSLAAGAPGVDENDTRVATPLKLAARLSEATGAGSLFIHHSRKDESDDRKMVRGSTAIYADCDWAYKFENVEETRAFRRMHMVNIKPAMGPKPPPVNLELTDERGLTWYDEDDAARAALMKGDRTPEAIQAAIKLALEGGPLETKDKVAKAVGARKELVTAELDALLVRREIALVPGLGYVSNEPKARAQRVCTLVTEYRHWKSEAAIAKAAGLDTEAVHELVRAGVICRSAEGHFQAVNRE